MWWQMAISVVVGIITIFLGFFCLDQLEREGYAPSTVALFVATMITLFLSLFMAGKWGGHRQRGHLATETALRVGMEYYTIVCKDDSTLPAPVAVFESDEGERVAVTLSPTSTCDKVLLRFVVLEEDGVRSFRPR